MTTTPQSWEEASVEVDALLERTIPRPKVADPPTKNLMRPALLLIRDWASSQVAAYRVGLILGYLGMIYFGASALTTGVPVFSFTTPEGWTPIWACAVIAGGFVGGMGALRAGAEPITKDIKVFNWIELVGAVLLFLTLGIYASVLLYIGYVYGDIGRISNGSGFVALGVNPAVRMVWLILRPRFLHGNHIYDSSSVIIASRGYTVLKTDANSYVVPKPEKETGQRRNAETPAVTDREPGRR